MSKLNTTLAAAAILCGSHSAFAWTPYDGPMNNLIAQSNNLTQQMQTFQNDATVGAMNDPQVQQAYRQYQAQGGDQDYPTWALNYRATLGYNPGVMRQVYGQNGANAAAVRRSWNDLLLAQARRAAVLGASAAGFSDDQYQQGLLNGGWRYYQSNDGYTHWYRP